MLVACRLAGLSALETNYAGVGGGAQCGRDSRFGRIAGGSRREAAWRSRFRSGSRARSTMKGPAPCDGAGNRGCGAGQSPSVEGQGGNMARRGLIAR